MSDDPFIFSPPRMKSDDIQQLRTLIQTEVGGLRTEHQHLIGFLSTKFDGIDGRFDRLEGRMTGLEGRMTGLEGRVGRVEIGQEGIQDELRAVAEGVASNGERLDRMNDSIDGVEGLLKELGGLTSSPE